MKSAYELAMERLAKSSPTVRLSEEQKKQIAELESKYKAKIAEREIALRAGISSATAQGDIEATQTLEKQLVHERKKLQAELEEKRDSLRQKK